MALYPRGFLQRKGDEVAEAAFGQGVLIGKKPVVGSEADLGTALHRFCQEIGSQLSCEGCGDGFLKENPNVPAVAGA